MTDSAALLVDDVFPKRPVRQWVLSVPFPLRFLFASRPDVMSHVLGIVYRCISTQLCRKAGFTGKVARTGAVTLIQRFGSALNLNVHFHMLFLDGVYVDQADGSLRFRWVKEPSRAELAHLTHTLAERIARYLERQGLLERDAQNSYLAGDMIESGAIEHLQGASITYRIATWAAPSPHSRGARCSPCRRCQRLMSPSMTASGRWRGFRCMPVSRRKPTSEGSSNACADTSAARRLPRSVSR